MITLANVTLYTMESNPNSTMGVWASVPPCHAAIPDLSQVQLGPVLVLSLSLCVSNFMQSQRLMTPAPQMANSITFLVVECRMVNAKRHDISTAAKFFVFKTKKGFARRYSYHYYYQTLDL